MVFQYFVICCILIEGSNTFCGLWMIHAGNDNIYKQVEASVSGLSLGNSGVLFSPPKLDYSQSIVSLYHKVDLQKVNLTGFSFYFHLIVVLLKSSKLLAHFSKITCNLTFQAGNK